MSGFGIIDRELIGDFKVKRRDMISERIQELKELLAVSKKSLLKIVHNVKDEKTGSSKYKGADRMVELSGHGDVFVKNICAQRGR